MFSKAENREKIRAKDHELKLQMASVAGSKAMTLKTDINEEQVEKKLSYDN